MKTYRGKKLEQLIFPLGGIGTGSVGLAGNGRFRDFEIFNQPDKGSLLGMSHIAVRTFGDDGKISARVLSGDVTNDKMGTYQQGYYHGYGFGTDRGTMAGFPHFRDCTFRADFPLAELSFSDPNFPCRVRLEAFNPMIPGDSFDSSLPAAFFTVSFRNPTDKPLRCEAAFSLENPYPDSVNRPMKNVPGGVIFTSGKPQPRSRKSGNMALVALGNDTARECYWYRGGWMDGVTTYWRNFTELKTLPDRQYDVPGGGDTATVTAGVTVPAGKTASVRFLLCWYHPFYENTWDPAAKDAEGKPLCWKNWYATQFRDADAVARYCRRRFASLRRRSRAFAASLSRATLPPAVIDAASSCLSVLKSPTVLRLTDGTFWGWEGVHEKAGSCEGTCTHVWNYAYALCYLFPDLERSIRTADYRYNQLPSGLCRFRLPLPPRPANEHDFPCLDGQMGGVIKTYREWKLSGDTEFLRSVWDGVKAALAFAYSPDSAWKWDADMDGVLEGRQHHTLDMELFGPSGWLEGFYLAALKAGAEMADAMGEPSLGDLWRELYARGKEFTERELWNGSYYAQKIDLTDKEQLRPYGDDVVARYFSEEHGEVKYQIGDGCDIDMLCGQWHADLCGLGDVFDPAHRKTAVRNLYRNNFAASQRERYNCWRLYAVNDDAGACICSYPEGTKKPAIPVPYTEECMHGFEYELAGLLVAEGMTDEALSVVKGVRDRYDGEARNPFNEMECGSNYARSMAAFALVPLSLGFSFDMTEKRIGFRPVGAPEEFAAPFGVDGAYCNVKFTKPGVRIDVLEGRLTLSALDLPDGARPTHATADGKPAAVEATPSGVRFPDTVTVTKSLLLF